MTNSTAGAAPRPRYGIQAGDPIWLAFGKVSGRHLGALAALVCVSPTWPLLVLCVLSYALRIWAMEAVYHRYFAHAAYRAGRGVQFALAVLGTLCGQRGPLWWAATHRTHHRYADTPGDPHSPVDRGFLHAHARWLTDSKHLATDLDQVADFARYPELRWLNRYYWVPLYLSVPLLYAAGALGWLGTSISGLAAVLWGGFLPVALTLHMTSLVNSIGHMPEFPGGYRRYPLLRDRSVNRPLLALLTLGAAWHNNHHRYGAAARSGFAWYEFDAVYGSLRLLQALGVIASVRSMVPEAILHEGGLGHPALAATASEYPTDPASPSSR